MYSSCEENVIDWTGKSQVLFNEIESQYAFVGGTHSEYIRYFEPPDLPDEMWTFTCAQNVRAVAGFSVVPNKNGIDQCKLLMQRSANYAWCSGKDRSNFGLLGGAALASVHVPEDRWAVSVCDESAAFTSVRTPPWMWRWSCCPPIRRCKLPARFVDGEVRDLAGREWVYPMYQRLAMGGTHSVHIIMSINLHAQSHG